MHIVTLLYGINSLFPKNKWLILFKKRTKKLFLQLNEIKNDRIMTSLFENINSWSLLIQIFIITAAMLIGNIIRRKIGFMNRSLIPTALIGGLLIFLLKLIPSFNDLIDKNTMEIITYHTLALGFIAMSLRVKKESCVTSTTKVIETGVLTIGTYIGKQNLLAELKTYELVDQYLFHTEHALQLLTFIQAREILL